MVDYIGHVKKGFRMRYDEHEELKIYQREA
jgi:hypothetical protein